MNFSKSVKKFQKKIMKKGSWVHVAIVVSVVLLLVGVFWPRKKLGIRMVPVEGTTHFKAVLEHMDNPKSKCILYKADEWCGFCKRLKPEWEKCKNDKELTDKIEFVEYDVDNDNDKEAFEKVTIKGYPTIHLIGPNGEVKPYDGERTYAAIRNFLKENM